MTRLLAALAFCSCLFIVSNHASAQAIGLQNATATFSQTGFSAAGAIDNNNTTGWAIQTAGLTTSAETLVVQTATPLSAAAVRFTLTQNFGSQHVLGRFRFSYTTDATVSLGGTWTVLDAADGTFTDTLGNYVATAPGDGSWLVSGSSATASYQVGYLLPVSNITGFRLEALEDASLPQNGPGLHAVNGNFVIYELSAEAVPAASIPTLSEWGMIFLFAALAATIVLRRRAEQHLSA